MFTRARVHLTLLYAALLGVTVVLVAGAIGLLAVQEARRTDDRELQVRAAAMAASVPQGLPPLPTGPPFGAPRPGEGGPGPPHLEEQGLLEYVMPVFGSQAVTPPFGGLTGLPDVAAAQGAIQAGVGQYRTDTIVGNQVRIYSLPVVRQGQIVALVQIARSRYFVNAAVAYIALIALIAGLAGLLLSAAASYWLAGRTLRPIAVALRRQHNFVADASHELRTPLTVLLTNTELLTYHPERPLSAYRDVVDDMIAELQRLSRLVSDLLTLARADEAGPRPSRRPVDLSQLAQTVARQFAPLAAARKIELGIAIQPDVVVLGDGDRLQQLALILVDNAVRYTGEGRVDILVARRGRDATLSVSDTGPGIPREALPHLFERFYRIDSARSAEDGGSGLGLALAQWIAESHGTQIDVASTPGRGSVFSLHLAVSRRRPGVRAGSRLRSKLS